MRSILWAAILLLPFASILSAQEPSREQEFQKLTDLNAQIQDVEKNFFLPDKKDIKTANSLGLSVFRLLPRERYDRKLVTQGGGSYFSFTTGSHDYQKIAQLGLEQNYLKVGFAGADYGFIADLGEASLTNITQETAEIDFLLNYKVPSAEKEVRAEQRRSKDYDVNGLRFKSHIPATVGHSYVLRAISFDRADVLVAFSIIRKDSDGSLILLWKTIETFQKPTFERAPPN